MKFTRIVGHHIVSHLVFMEFLGLEVGPVSFCIFILRKKS